MSEQRAWRWALVGVAAVAAAGVWNAGVQPVEAQRSASTSCCVAVVDLNVVLEALEERRTREQELQAFIRTRQNELDEMRRQAQQAQDDLRILSEKTPDWYAKRDEAAALAIQLRGREELAKALVEDKRKLMSIELFDKIRAAAGRYASKEGFAVVISSDTGFEVPQEAPEQQVQAMMTGRRLLYAADSSDISQAVAQMMNNEFKAR